MILFSRLKVFVLSSFLFVLLVGFEGDNAFEVKNADCVSRTSVIQGQVFQDALVDKQGKICSKRLPGGRMQMMEEDQGPEARTAAGGLGSLRT